MLNPRISKAIAICLFCLLVSPKVHAQLSKITENIDSEKPQKFKDKTLKAEKTGDKKFNLPRRFIQNTVSHYNYFFNAHTKIDEVIERARMAQRDDYNQLLPFYSYSLDNTAAQKRDLDSVIYKATAGILIHDLRSDWVDNLYQLIGEAYYFRKDFDSAYITFQFINYNLFPRNKKDEDDQLIVGSNENGNKQGISVVSKEDPGFLHRIWRRPPSRNDALVWQVRALIDLGDFGVAAGLISTLQNDPNFPQRLVPYFEEMRAYWFYNQQMYDSTLPHLILSLPNCLDIEAKARREFLIAQLYEKTGDQQEASGYYEKAMHLTTNPLLEIYANLNRAKMIRNHDPAVIDKAISTLVHMARKDKYEPYRDLIYFSAAQLAMIKPDTLTAFNLYKSSARYNTENISMKNKAFLEMAAISYRQKDYRDAYNYYDSVQTQGDTALTDISDIRLRKKTLASIVTQMNIINREDSLQAIAAMTDADRNAYLKKLSRKLMKQKGAKEEAQAYANEASAFFKSQDATYGMGGNMSPSGAWYFYDNAMKSNGYNEFSQTWGKRQNVDNWRRAAASSAAISANSMGSPDGNDSSQIAGQAPGGNAPGGEGNLKSGLQGPADYSVAGLLANVPLTPEKMRQSNGRLTDAYFQLGKDYQNHLADYQAAIGSYDTSLHRFPDSLFAGELYLNLSFCYRKIGDQAKADYYKNLLLKKFEKSKFAKLAAHPEEMEASYKDSAATKSYEAIYTHFIEGDFQQAVDEKRQADSLYGTSYWTPQLLWIESVYYIKKREDTTAIGVLNQIITHYPGSPLQDRAVTMIDVLKRRKQIENYLTNLKVTRVREDSQIVVQETPEALSSQNSDTATITRVQKDTSRIVPAARPIEALKKPAPKISNKFFTFDPNAPQEVMMVMTKVDPVYSSEAKNAFTRFNEENFYARHFTIQKDTLDSIRTVLLFSPFDNANDAILYMNRLKKSTQSEISWLPANKYAFYIISEDNLQLLKENKNLKGYIDLLTEKYPGKF